MKNRVIFCLLTTYLCYSLVFFITNPRGLLQTQILQDKIDQELSINNYLANLKDEVIQSLKISDSDGQKLVMAIEAGFISDDLQIFSLNSGEIKIENNTIPLTIPKELYSKDIKSIQFIMPINNVRLSFFSMLLFFIFFFLSSLSAFLKKMKTKKSR